MNGKITTWKRKGFNVWNPPTAESVDAFSAHACGTFEDWVYSLFREPDGLSKPGNAKLYSLLCKIRSQLRSRLRNILLHGYSTETDDGNAEQTPLLLQVTLCRVLLIPHGDGKEFRSQKKLRTAVTTYSSSTKKGGGERVQ